MEAVAAIVITVGAVGAVIKLLNPAGWTEIGQLGAIAIIRTFLNYFLEHDVERYGEEQPVED